MALSGVRRRRLGGLLSDTVGIQLRSGSDRLSPSERSAVLTEAACEASSLTSDAEPEDGPTSGISPSSTTSLIWEVWAISPFSIAVLTTSSFSSGMTAISYPSQSRNLPSMKQSPSRRSLRLVGVRYRSGFAANTEGSFELPAVNSLNSRLSRTAMIAAEEMPEWNTTWNQL